MPIIHLTYHNCGGKMVSVFDKSTAARQPRVLSFGRSPSSREQRLSVLRNERNTRPENRAPCLVHGALSRAAWLGHVQRKELTMLVRTTTPFTLISETADHTVTPDFVDANLTIFAMVDRIRNRTRYLAAFGGGVKGVKVSDAKDAASEIRGMISLLSAVCTSPTLQAELLNGLQEALDAALARLRK